METVLPPARTPGHYAVAFVCSGNICRSPSADVVLASKLVDAGLHDRVEVASCGIGDWHVGRPMDDRSARHLAEAGYDPSRHRAQQVRPDWLERYDVLFAMDGGHLEALHRLARDGSSADGDGDGRVRMFRELDPEPPTGGERRADREVPDPYYGGEHGFTEVLEMVERTCEQLVTELRAVVDEDRA